MENPMLRNHLVLAFLLFLCIPKITFAANQDAKLAELDAMWNEVARSVREGDFDGYAATCHPQGVLVTEAKQTSYPLTKALAGWKQGFVDTKAGKMKANVEFRFSHRIGDETTAHETGIFRYTTVDDTGNETAAHIHFAALLVKTNGHWQVLMEHQKTKATKEEWNALAPPQ